MADLAINGGEKSSNLIWPEWPIWDDEERKAINSVLESGEWCSGKKANELEVKFAEFQGAKFGVTCSNGAAALEVALVALGVGSGDEVIIPSYAFMSTANAVLRVKAIPVFADILPWTLCIDHDDVVRKITNKTKAIIPVHLAGYVADMDCLREIAASHNLFLIEDACQALGSEWMGKGAGTLGKCGVFSIQTSQNLSYADSGIIITDDEEVAEACRSLMNPESNQTTLLSSNSPINEFQAAILLAQLTRLKEQTIKRQCNAGILTDGLREVPGIYTIEHDPRMTRRSYQFFPFRISIDYLEVSRDRFVEVLAAEGIPITSGYTTPLYKNQSIYTSDSINCPICEQACLDTCWIPHNVLLADDEAMDAIIDAAYKVSENISELL